MGVLGMIAVWIDRDAIVDRASWSMPIMVYAVWWQESLIGQTVLAFLKNVAMLLIALVVVRALWSLARARAPAR